MSILDKYKEKYKNVKITSLKDAQALKRRVFADTIFINGNIETNDTDNEHPDILAVKDCYVVAATSSEELHLLQGKKTQVIDLAGQTLRPGTILWNESFTYTREDESAFIEKLSEWSKQGITSVFNSTDDIEGEIVTRDILMDAMHAKITPVRYFGSMILREKKDANAIRLTLDSQAKICMSLNGFINFDTLIVYVDGGMDEEYLRNLFSNCGSKGYNIRVYTSGKESTMLCARAMADIAASYTFLTFTIFSDYRPELPELQDLDAPELVFMPDNSISAARLIGKGKFLGSLAEGKMADFCMFNQDGECICTYISGKPVYNAADAANWQTQYFDSQHGKNRKSFFK